MQAARIRGAGRIIAVGRNVERLERLRDRGADAIVVLGDDNASAIRNATEGGADVIFDALFGAVLPAALRSAKPGARSVTVGSLAGATSEIGFFQILGKTLLTYTNNAMSIQDKRDAIAQMAGHVLAGELVVEYERVALTDIEAAWKRQVSGADTKLVVIP
ncbi:MAG: zinc-binding dehydrogenase [Acidimicrobiia bacterium]